MSVGWEQLRLSVMHLPKAKANKEKALSRNADLQVLVEGVEMDLFGY